MTGVLAILAYLVLPLIGIGVLRFDFVRREPLAVRLSIATAAGALMTGVTMAVLSTIGIEWSRAVLFPLFALIGGAGYWSARKSMHAAGEKAAPVEPSVESRWGVLAIAVPWLLTLYGTITARESCGDLQFTWGPKAIRFFRAGGLDPQVLHTWPQLTVDYPPLQTLLFAWSNTVSHQFSWWGAVLLSPLLFLPLLILVWKWSGDSVGTLLFAAAMSWCFAIAYPAGCAEPLLLLFEGLAILALTFVKDPRAQTFYVTLGLAGSVLTKLEGTTFAIAVLLTMLIVQRNARRALVVAIPAAILIGSWMAFVFYNELLYMYGGARLPMYFEALPIVLRTLTRVAKFELYWLPWLVPVAVIALGRPGRALAPLAIFLLTTGATIYFYLHYPDPTWWIESSSTRVLLTPLMALLLAAAAAWRPRTN